MIQRPLYHNFLYSSFHYDPPSHIFSHILKPSRETSDSRIRRLKRPRSSWDRNFPSKHQGTSTKPRDWRDTANSHGWKRRRIGAVQQVTGKNTGCVSAWSAERANTRESVARGEIKGRRRPGVAFSGHRESIERSSTVDTVGLHDGFNVPATELGTSVARPSGTRKRG